MMGSEQRYRVVVIAIEQLRPGVSVVPERRFGSSGSRLFGRDADAAMLDQLVARVREQGGALVVRGDPGIGKTALLAVASDAASSKGVSVLRTAGAQSETGLAFAGLHQLLRPVLARLDRLPGSGCSMSRRRIRSWSRWRR
jgi:predicted ATPase